MVSGRLARSRKSGPGSSEVVNRKCDGSRKSGPGGPEVVNDQFDKELNRETDGFR